MQTEFITELEQQGKNRIQENNTKINNFIWRI